MPFSNVHLTPHLVQAVRDAIDIVEIASEYTRLKGSGRGQSGLCPLHKEKTPSFSVDAEKGVFYCFGCGQGGDAIRLHMLLTGDDFPAAIESLAGRYGIQLPSRQRAQREGPEIGPALAAAERFFCDQLERAAGPREYLERRGISEELIRRYRLGYAPDSWEALHRTLGSKVPLDALEAAGLVGRSEKRAGRPYDRFRNRLMFPIRVAAGRLVGFGGRALGDDPARYVNTPETASFQKRHLLFGLDQAKRAAREGGRLLIVEGYFDQLAAAACGIDWAVASMGTSLTPEQARLAARFADEVVLGYDGDTAGQDAARRAIPVLLAAGLTVRRIDLPPGEDPDSLRQSGGPEALQEAVSTAADAVAAELARLTPPAIHHSEHEKRRAAEQVRELLAPIEDPTLRVSYGRLAAGRLGLPWEELLRRAPRTVERRSAPEAGARRSPVRSLEERVLELLLALPEAVPPPEALPPTEAFLDAPARNILECYCALYKQDGRPPDGKAVLAALEGSPEDVEHLARLMIECPVGASTEELALALRQIGARWRRLRLQELKLRIDEAQRQGDLALLERLLDEKTSVSHALHRPADASVSGRS